jgi:hypothetical protein
MMASSPFAPEGRRLPFRQPRGRAQPVALDGDDLHLLRELAERPAVEIHVHVAEASPALGGLHR